MNQIGTLVVISGTSGGGKSFLQTAILETDEDFVEAPSDKSRDATRSTDELLLRNLVFHQKK